MSSFCKKAFLFFSSLIVLTALNCQKKIVGPEMENFGSIELRIQLLDNLTKQNALLLTPFDSLSVTISAPDMKTMYVSKKIESGKIFVNDTILNVPAGSNRAVTICTKDKSGEIIHHDSLGVRNCRINQNEPFIINSRLIPICGSLYIQLADIPKTVDSVIVKFVAKDNTSLQTRVKR